MFDATDKREPVVIEGGTLYYLMSKMESYRKKTTILAVQIPYDFIVRQDADDAAIRGDVHAVAGSWLAMGRPGVFYPITDETFRLQYEREEESNGQ